MKSAEKYQKYPERINTDDIATIPFLLSDGSSANVDVYGVQCENALLDVPTIIIPGFTEGITQDAKFANYLSDASQSNIFVIGQYERTDKNFIGAKEALENQALAVLAFIEQIQSQNKPVNVFANSLGAAVFVRAAEIAVELNWSCFTSGESNVVLMAPAGLKQNDNAAKVGTRFAIDGGLKAHVKEGHGWDKDSLDAGQVLIKADPKKAVGEALAAATAKIDFAKLKELGISPDVITSPKDGVMGQRALGESIISLLNDGILGSWSTPYSAETRGTLDMSEAQKAKLSKAETVELAFGANSGAEHNTHMVNDAQAKRTAQAVANIFSLK